MSKFEEIKKELERPDNITKEVKILSDGKQFMIKIPYEVADFFKIKKYKKGDKERFIFKIDMEIPSDEKQESINRFYIIKKIIKNDEQKIQSTKE